MPMILPKKEWKLRMLHRLTTMMRPQPGRTAEHFGRYGHGGRHEHHGVHDVHGVHSAARCAARRDRPQTLTIPQAGHESPEKEWIL